MSNFPEGPYTVAPNGRTIAAADGFSVATLDLCKSIVPGWSEKFPGLQHWADAPGEAYIERPEEELDAVAALFAAAPDLLAALKRIVDQGFSAQAEAQARAALARAQEVSRG